MAQLVKVGDLKLGAALDFARSGLQVAQHQLEQGRLASTVGAQQANTVLALQNHGEVLDQHRAIGVREADIFERHDLLAGLVRNLDLDVRLTLALATFAALDTQCLQGAHTTLVTGTPGLDALANPNLFLSQTLVEQRIGSFLGGQHGLLVYQKLA